MLVNMRVLGAASLCVVCVCCTDRQGILNNRPAQREQSVLAPESTQLGRTSTERRRVRAILLDCVIEKELGLQESLPDGRTFESALNDSTASPVSAHVVRLHSVGYPAKAT